MAAPHVRVQPRSRAILPPKSLAAIAAAVVATLVIALITWRSLAARADAAEAVNHSNDVRRHAGQLLSDMKDAETGQRGYVLTGDPKYLEPYDRAVAAVPAELAALHTLVVDQPDQADRMAALEPLAKRKLAELAHTIELEKAGTHAQAVDFVKSDVGRETMDRIRTLQAELVRAEQATFDERTESWEQTVRWSSIVSFGGTALIVVMLFMVGSLASRDFRAVENEAWQRRVQLAVAGSMRGDHRLESLGDKILSTLVGGVDAQVGAVFVAEPDGRLRRVAGHALPIDAPATLAKGEGVAGQAVKDAAIVSMKRLPAGYLQVSSATGKSAPREVIVAPATADGAPQAVIELGFLRELDATERSAVERLVEDVGLAFRSARDRQRLESLLEETQRQAEELQAQQEELRVTNEELEQQTRALQMSQQQLENQQSELEEINMQLERQASTLERANEYKSQFLANMSHELRTPLNSSLILAKLLADNKRGNLDAEQVKFAQTIYSAGNDLLTLINDILDLSKIEAGMLDVRPEPVPLTRLCDDLAATFKPTAAQKQIALTTVVHKGAPNAIETDPTRLVQILRNLLGNALKFTERGGVTLEISGAGDKIAFAVTDTGIGIAAEQHELIFEAFRQADGGSNRKYGGTGLGLSISRDLARLLGGDLTVTSAQGKGSTFTLVLPRKIEAKLGVKLPAKVAAIVEGKAPAPAPAPAVSNGANGHARVAFADDRVVARPGSRSLLVVEDDEAFAKILFDLAHELEFQAMVAATAEDGLRLAREHLPSAIVLDVGLPDRSGLSVLDTLKRDPKTRHIPVHVVSANDYTRAALEMGAAGYALKPVEREQLVEAIKKLESKFTQKLRRVLVVEDDEILRASTAKLLEGDDVETVTAGSGAEALKQLSAKTFDCMVLDLSLPDRSGVELLEEMSHGAQYGFPPVIVYTGRSLSSEQVHELERFSRSIIIKGARSPERLLDEVTLFLHQVESDLPPDRQRMLRDARDRESVFEGRRILVVEDDVRNLFALSSVLEPKGAVVDIARNGREAIERLEARPDVDLVLMDIMMPEMDGLEATRRLRADPKFAKLPIIALTAKAMIDDREKCLAAGANDYIAKPLDVDKLLSLARVWIRR